MNLNWKHYTLIGAIILALGAGAWFLIGRIFPSNPPGPTKSEVTSDSLKATKPAEVALIDSSNARIAARQPSSALAEAAVKASHDRANVERHRADSLAALAVQQDSSVLAWKNAYEARNSEAIDLRSTIASDNTIIFNLKADTTDLRFQLKTVNKRLKTTEDVNKGLRDDLDAARECKILWKINCPSRIQSVVLTLLTVKGIEVYQARTK